MAKRSHPGIVVVHDSGQIGGLYYFIMEYIDGLNLRELLHRSEEGRLDADRALQIVHALCDALAYAPGAGGVHRDIKPENILLDTTARAKVVRFGPPQPRRRAGDGPPLAASGQDAPAQ